GPSHAAGVRGNRLRHRRTLRLCPRRVRAGPPRSRSARSLQRRRTRAAAAHFGARLMLKRLLPVQISDLGNDEVEVVMSTGTIARDGHILVPQGALLDSYRANP